MNSIFISSDLTQGADPMPYLAQLTPFSSRQTARMQTKTQPAEHCSIGRAKRAFANTASGQKSFAGWRKSRGTGLGQALGFGIFHHSFCPRSF